MLPNHNMEEDTSSTESSNPQNGSENNIERYNNIIVGFGFLMIARILI